jgi:hypothetical protein
MRDKGHGNDPLTGSSWILDGCFYYTLTWYWNLLKQVIPIGMIRGMHMGTTM